MTKTSILGQALIKNFEATYELYIEADRTYTQEEETKAKYELIYAIARSVSACDSQSSLTAIKRYVSDGYMDGIDDYNQRKEDE